MDYHPTNFISMNTKNHYIFNGVRPDVAIPEEEGIAVQYWLAYRSLMRTLKRELKDNTVRYELKRLVPELPLPYDRAIEVIDTKMNNATTNNYNLKKMKKAMKFIQDKDMPSALRLILRTKRS